MPKAYGRYPSRAQVVEYLEAYAAKFGLKPVFNAPVRAVAARRASCGAPMRARTREARPSSLSRPAGPTTPIRRHGQAWRRSAARSCIRAAIAIRPLSPANACWSSAMAIRARRSRSTSPKPGVDVALSVRSPVNIVPRELFGVPILFFPAAEQWLPPRVADALNAPLHPVRDRPDRRARPEALRQGAAPGDQGRRARPAHRRRHARCDTRRTDQASRRRRKLRPRERRLQAVARPSASTRSFSRPASARICARCCPTPRAC